MQRKPSQAKRGRAFSPRSDPDLGLGECPCEGPQEDLVLIGKGRQHNELHWQSQLLHQPHTLPATHSTLFGMIEEKLVVNPDKKGKRVRRRGKGKGRRGGGTLCIAGPIRAVPLHLNDVKVTWMHSFIH